MLLELVAAAGPAAFLYHHVGYPLLLRGLAARQRSRRVVTNGQDSKSAGKLPSIDLIIPVYNEAGVIAAKIEMLARLAYPRELLRCVIVCDGCTDASAAIARRAAEQVAPGVVEVVEHEINRGKVAVLNEAVSSATGDIVALSDASAAILPQALLQLIAHFDDPAVGVVCPTYRLGHPGNEGEAAYWRYQTAIKADEAELGAPMGAHGAFYLFRRKLWTPLPLDTINDDVILPMRIVAQGYRAAYDETVAAIEMEPSTVAQDFKRRIRIGAGNMQQMLRLASLADPRRPGLAFVFLSGKALRCLFPFLAIASVLATFYLALSGSLLFMSILLIGALACSFALLAFLHWRRPVPRPLQLAGYLVEGHAASFLGAMRYLSGFERKPWRKVQGTVSTPTMSEAPADYVPTSVEVSKRVIDIVCALGALLVLAVLFVPLAIAIKIDSRGPIFYRQLRVGRCTETATHLFYLIKLRTMRTDSEVKTGAVWATKDDPRITRVGRFLRKTRLDELPQAINVLRGEMSVVGPRPERPSFFPKLEDAIPFYIERTYGLRPGITGLAQVNQAYDQSIEDVRNKVLYDHAYAARLSRWSDWLKADFGIMLKTVTVMALGKGQ